MWDYAKRKRKVKRPRDSQKSKLYRAERHAFLSGDMAFFQHDLHAFPDLKACRLFALRVVQSKTVRRWWPHTTRITDVYVGPGKGARIARGSYDWSRSEARLKLPRWSRNKPIILHELAHSISEVNAGPGQRPAHGREFAGILLKLVGLFIGREAKKRLLAAYKKYQVRYKPKKKLTLERLAQLQQRGRELAAARKRGSEEKC